MIFTRITLHLTKKYMRVREGTMLDVFEKIASQG